MQLRYYKHLILPLASAPLTKENMAAIKNGVAPCVNPLRMTFALDIFFVLVFVEDLAAEQNSSNLFYSLLLMLLTVTERCIDIFNDIFKFFHEMQYLKSYPHICVSTLTQAPPANFLLSLHSFSY